MDILAIFGLGKASKKETEDLGELYAGLRDILANRSDDEVRLITGVAGLLGKVAYADMEFSGAEISRMRQVLAKHLKLEGKRLEPILELLGRHKARLFSVEDYIYLRIIDGVMDHGEKLNLLRTLFSVAAADELVSSEEDAVLWTVAKGLRLSHQDFISVRAEFKEHLSVLK